MEAGRKATPFSHLEEFIVTVIQIGREGSSMAIPRLANVMAPGKGKKVVGRARVHKLGLMEWRFV